MKEKKWKQEKASLLQENANSALALFVFISIMAAYFFAPMFFRWIFSIIWSILLFFWWLKYGILTVIVIFCGFAMMAADPEKNTKKKGT